MSTTVLLLNLGFIANFPHLLFGVTLGNVDFLHCNWIQKCWNSFPGKPNGAGCVHSEHFVQFASIVERHLGSAFLDGVHGHFSDSHSSEIINNDPAFDLSGNKHFFNDLFVDKDWCNDPRLDIFEINEFGIEDKDGSEVEVSSHRVEKAWFLELSKKIRWAFRPFKNWVEGNRFWTEGAPSSIWLFILVCNDGLAKRAAIFGRWSILGRFRFYA